MRQISIEQARVSGRVLHDPARFEHRKRVAHSGQTNRQKLGTPSEHLDETEKRAWGMFQDELPYLREGHRPVMELAAKFRARRLRGLVASSSEITCYRQLLRALGATPTDEGRVSVPPMTGEF